MSPDSQTGGTGDIRLKGAFTLSVFCSYKENRCKKCELYFIMPKVYKECIIYHYLTTILSSSDKIKILIFRARCTKQGKLALELNSKNVLMGVESSVRDLLTLNNTDATGSFP